MDGSYSHNGGHPIGINDILQQHDSAAKLTKTLKDIFDECCNNASSEQLTHFIEDGLETLKGLKTDPKDNHHKITDLTLALKQADFLRGHIDIAYRDGFGSPLAKPSENDPVAKTAWENATSIRMPWASYPLPHQTDKTPDPPAYTF